MTSNEKKNHFIVFLIGSLMISISGNMHYAKEKIQQPDKKVIKMNKKLMWMDTVLNSGKPTVRILENGVLTFKPFQTK